MKLLQGYRSVVFVAALLCLGVPLRSAQAQRVVYTVFGSVTSASNPSGPWAGVAAGDPIRVAFIVRTDIAPSAQTATSRTFLYPDSAAVQPAYAVAGPYRADYRYDIEVNSAEFLIADDDGASPARDVFRGVMRSESLGDVLFEYSETAPSAPVPTAMTGLDWPLVAELDLSSWASGRMEISGDFGAGPMVISGAISSVIIQDVDCWRIDYTEDGLLDFGDYLQFLSYYSEGDPRADLCGCGLVDFQSYLDFLNYFEACGGT